MAQDVIEALAENRFVNIKRNWEKWEKRNDLFDYVVTKSVEFITKFINQIEKLKMPTLAALFIKRSDVVDEVLKKIKYSDSDLIILTYHRPELAEYHSRFFKAIDKINGLENQAEAVRSGVKNLFKAKKHASVIPLIDALENRIFRGRKLKNVAILKAFDQGAFRGIKNIVEEFHEHPAITPKEYSYGLIRSWENDNSKKTVFPFLLAQADQGDLELTKRWKKYVRDAEFRDEIDNAVKTAPLAGIRHIRFLVREKARLAIIVLDDITNTGIWNQGLGSIIKDYIVNEHEWTTEMEMIASNQGEERENA